ncbi:MAG: alpha/beta fold hydrolase [Thermoguttaceae bacterium]|nr:alpha/beta fold hydrolase [Thermoguttaceae bacterium]
MKIKTLARHASEDAPDSLAGSRGFPYWALTLVAALLVIAAGRPQQVCGQETAKAEEEIPAPQESVLTTPQDGVQLAVTYYPAIKPDKNVVPIVLLHQFKGSQRDYVDLALLLQRAGHAVILPDLRGHGRSTTSARLPHRLDADRFRPADFQRMVVDDMEAVNRFLWDRNNDGELNVNKLCIVGAEMGASVALLYATRDWSIPPVGPLQLGQFVKGVVLISPEWSFKGLTMQNAMRHPAIRSEVSMLIAVGGRQSTAAREAKRIHDMIKPHRPDPAPNRVAEEKDLFYAELDTALQGTDILGQNLKLEQFIAQFVNLRLVKAPKAAAFGWAERKRPHQ